MEEMFCVASGGSEGDRRENSSMWKVITGSDDEVFGVASEGLKFRMSPSRACPRRRAKMLLTLLPLSSKELLPFNLVVRGQVPGRSHFLSNGMTFISPNGVL